MSTTPPKRRAPARKPRAAMAPAEAIAEIVGDVSLDLPAQASLLPASIDDAVDDIFQALMEGDDADAADAAALPAPVAEAPVAPAAPPARKRASRARAAAVQAEDTVAAPQDAKVSEDGAAPGAGADVVVDHTGATDGAATDPVAPAPRKRSPARKRAKPGSGLPEGQGDGDAFAKLQSGPQPEVLADADASAQAGALADAQPGPQTDAHGDAETGVEAGEKADAQPDAPEAREQDAQDLASAPAEAGRTSRPRGRSPRKPARDVALKDGMAGDTAGDEGAEAMLTDASPIQAEEPSPEILPSGDASPMQARRTRQRPAIARLSDAPDAPARFTLGSREDDGVFGDYELRDGETGGTFRMRLLGHGLWRCDCPRYLDQGDCDHGDHLLSLLDDDQAEALEAGWPAREAEVWLVPGPARQLQWVAGREVPAALRDQPGLDERQRRDAEQSQAWLQSMVSQARAAGVTLRVDAPVWPQLAWGRDAQARVQRLEAFMADGAALRGLLSDTLPVHHWEGAMFAVCAGRALLADDLGLGQQGAAIAAIRLWDQLFGAAPALIIAPEARHAAWQRDLARWLGEAAGQVQVAERPSAKAAPAVLVVDGVEQLDDDALASLRALEARTGAQLLLIANEEPLGHARLATWVDWLDAARRGPFARYGALPPEAGKKALRDALEPVVLSRRKRELIDRLPACLMTPLWLDAAGASLPSAPLKQLRQSAERWKTRPFLSSAEQQQLMQALALLPPASRQALAAKAEAVVALRKEWVESAQPAASRLVVCSRSETLLDSLAQSPQLRRLPTHRLHAGQSEAAVAQALQAWRAAPAGILMASDDTLASLPIGLLADDRVAVVHADLPWQAQTLEERVTWACGEQACGVPAALLLISGSLDAGLLKAQRQGLSFPAWLDAPPAWLAPEQIEALMAVLPALLDTL